MSGFAFRVLVILLLTALSFAGFACDDDDDNDDSVDDDTVDDDADDDTGDDDTCDDDTCDDDTSDDDTDDDDTIDDDDTGPDDVYVSVNGDDANPGTQTEPKRMITAGVELVTTGGTVYVAAGTYAESVSVSGVSLVGGYEDSGWTRDIAANQTIIEGVADQPALTITGASTKETVEVGGFSIQGNSSATDAYGVKIVDGADVAFTDNTVTVLQAETSLRKDKAFPFNDTSFGVYIADSTVDMMRNEINGNSGSPISHLSFGVYGERSTVEITENHIVGGEAGQTYGVYLAHDSVASIIDNDLDGGIADSLHNAFAIYVYENQPMTIANNSIYGGDGYGADGIILESSYVEVVNNMIDGGNGSYGSLGILVHQRCCSANIVNNSIFGGSGGRSRAISEAVLFYGPEDTIHLVNNIIDAGGGSSSSTCLVLDYDAVDHRQATLINNDFYDPDGDCLVMDHDVCLDDIAEVNACEFAGCVEASGNISAEPQWVSADDFHLTAGSLCIDAGIDPAPWYDGDLADYDFDGDPRPSGSGWDIGADEVVIAR
ncbi:MAG TPA: choice-of-anchor Q domain-containing protein [bacterium]|nr:choice-of-anchor Q domain-containing protein [bacterium]